jgi:hypothetical protein
LSATPTDARERPLPPPIPGTEFKRLTRRQSIIAWVVGAVVGAAVATAGILVVSSGLL